jgi:soluble lytic murein transglycosylase-like protein
MWMKWGDFRNMLAAAGLAALAGAGAAHAESGDGASVYSAGLAAVEPAEKAAVPAPAETAEAPSAEADPKAAKAVARSARDPQPSRSLKPLIERFAAENDLPAELADAVVRLESSYNPGARNGSNLGLTQIHLQAAKSLGYRGTAAGLLDAETNLRYGLQYLAQAYRLAHGDTCGTILRYQAGHRATTMTRAAKAYCAKVRTILARAG